MRGIFATSSLMHARARDEHGHQIACRPLCGARTTRTDSDDRATCGNCLRMLRAAEITVGAR